MAPILVHFRWAIGGLGAITACFLLWFSFPCPPPNDLVRQLEGARSSYDTLARQLEDQRSKSKATDAALSDALAKLRGGSPNPAALVATTPAPAPAPSEVVVDPACSGWTYKSRPDESLTANPWHEVEMCIKCLPITLPNVQCVADRPPRVIGASWVQKVDPEVVVKRLLKAVRTGPPGLPAEQPWIGWGAWGGQ